jgi:hypothetical protein
MAGGFAVKSSKSSFLNQNVSEEVFLLEIVGTLGYSKRQSGG